MDYGVRESCLAYQEVHLGSLVHELGDVLLGLLEAEGRVVLVRVVLPITNEELDLLEGRLLDRARGGGHTLTTFIPFKLSL